MNASRLLITLARGFFFKPGHRGALRRRRLDIRKTDPARLQKHEEMKHEVGTLGYQMRTIVLDRGDHGFDRLFAKLLGAMLRALVEQLLRVGRLTSRRGARVDGGGEIMDGKTRHQQNSTRCVAGGGACSPPRANFWGGGAQSPGTAAPAAGAPGRVRSRLLY